MRRAALFVALSLALCCATPPAAGAAVHRCTLVDIPGHLGAHSTVLSTRDTSCRHARRVVRKYGKGFIAPTDVGDRFRLGGWRCRVYKSIEEDHRARCTSRGRAFRVDYGS